jgi:hypothetical protein
MAMSRARMIIQVAGTLERASISKINMAAPRVRGTSRRAVG